MIAASGSLSRVVIGTSAGIEGVACVTVVAKALTHRDYGALPASLWLLVDRRVPARVLWECLLASVELVSLRQRALGLLCHRTLE